MREKDSNFYIADENTVCLTDNISLRVEENVAVDKIELQRLLNYVERTVDLVLNIFDERECS